LRNISERKKIIFTDLRWENNPVPMMRKDLEENKKKKQLKIIEIKFNNFFLKVSVTSGTLTGILYYNKPCNVNYHNASQLYVTWHNLCACISLNVKLIFVL